MLTERSRYVSFARSVDFFCRDLFAGWRKRAQGVAADALRQFILGPALEPATSRGGDAGDGGGGGGGDGYRKKVRFVLPRARFYVNFAPALSQLIKEATYLDRLGFTVPETALNVALQEGKYQQHCLLNGHEETRDLGIGDGDGGIAIDLFDEGRDH